MPVETKMRQKLHLKKIYQENRDILSYSEFPYEQKVPLSAKVNNMYIFIIT